MKRIKEIALRHKIAVILALVTSAVMAYPQLYFRIDHKELYEEGVQAIEIIPDSHWTPRVREVQDGHINWGSIYFKDGKDDPYLYQPLGSIIVAYTGMFFGLDINNTILLSRILYSAITFLLIYAFIYLLSRNKFASLSGVSAVLLAEPVLSPAGIHGLLKGAIFDGTSFINFVELSRPVNSPMIFIFFIGFLIPFWLFYRKNDWRWGAVSAVVLGLNFYNYFYTWTYLFAFGGVLCLIFLFQKKWSEILRISYVFLGALVVAIPYLWTLYSATQYPSYHDVAMRFGVLLSHAPVFIGATAFAGLIVFLAGYPRHDKEKYIFILSLLLTPFITLNQQVITGRVMQEGHYHWYMHKPMAVIFAIVTLFYLLEKWKVHYQYRKIIAMSIIVVSFAVGAGIQSVSYKNDREPVDEESLSVERQKYAPVMHWLNTHADKEDVVFANEDISNIVVTYTPLNVFNHFTGSMALVATYERMENIVFTFFRLEGIEREEAREEFYARRGFVSTRMFGIHYREKVETNTDESIPDEVLNSIIQDYYEVLDTPSAEWIHTIWKKYEVEYVVWDTAIDTKWDMKKLTFLKEKARFGDVVIYEVDQGAPPLSI